jgi:hypothetical protein
MRLHLHSLPQDFPERFRQRFTPGLHHRRRLSGALRALAIAAAFICITASAPAASARSVTGEYTPAANLASDVAVVFSETAPTPTDAPLITPPAAPVIPSAPVVEQAADSAPAVETAAAQTPPVAPAAVPAPAVEPAAAPASAPDAVTPQGQSAVSAIAIAAAISKIGSPYSYGAAGPSAFDCSGFTRWVYQQAGISLDHYSGAQWANTIHIPLDQLQPGDLVFNWGFGGGDPDHVGLYVGNGMMIHAPNSGASVRYDSIWWWTGATVAAGRLP